MKRIGIAMLKSISSITFAFDYPELFDPTQQKFLDMYIKDSNDLYKQDFHLLRKYCHRWNLLGPCRIGVCLFYKSMHGYSLCLPFILLL